MRSIRIGLGGSDDGRQSSPNVRFGALMRKIANFFADLHFGLYILFARIGPGLWPKAMDMEATKGTLGCAIIFSMWIIGADIFLSALTDNVIKISKSVFIVAFVASYGINYIILSLNKFSVTYEDKFHATQAGDKRRLLTLAGALVVITTMFVAASIYLYRHT